jgi:hypothetical protein
MNSTSSVRFAIVNVTNQDGGYDVNQPVAYFPVLSIRINNAMHNWDSTSLYFTVIRSGVDYSQLRIVFAVRHVLGVISSWYENKPD